jgi:DNA repair protein RecO (recombination protein O)
MSENATGIILRCRRFSETSLVVHWLCAEQGRVAVMAKGALRPKSPLLGKLDLFYLADLSFSRSSRSQLHHLREVMVREMHVGLRQDLDRLRQASHAAALIEAATESDTPVPEVFALLLAYLGQLNRAPLLRRYEYAFQIKLLNILGLAPDPGRMAKGAAELLAALRENSWEEIARLKPCAADAQSAGRLLRRHLVEHLGKLPE